MSTKFDHAMSVKTGILISNLGSPEAPTAKALRPYLREFLSDKRVVEIPAAVWKIILYGIILPFRSPKSAELYQHIWTEQGSPLTHSTQQLTQKLAEKFSDMPVVFSLGMRYGKPSIASALMELKQKQINKLIVLPLYPQYASATIGSTIQKVNEIINRWRWVPEYHAIAGYYDSPEYIHALSASIQKFWQQNGRSEKLLFSFHGIPKRAFLAGDPYFCHCHKTARLVASELKLADNEWQMVFQSRFGKAEWLQPYCDKTLIALATQGIKNVDVICPGFAVDCLETLEEIAQTYAELFRAHGGEKLNYIPALNDSSEQVKLLAKIIKKYL